MAVDPIREIKILVPAMLQSEVREFAPLVYEDLEHDVGYRIAALMTEDQLAEFERLTDAGDEEGSAAFLREHVPNQSEIVRDVCASLLEGIAQRLRREDIARGLLRQVTSAPA